MFKNQSQPGFDKVIVLAKLLVSLRECQVLSAEQAQEVVKAYLNLEDFDRQPNIYRERFSQKETVLLGRFKETRFPVPGEIEMKRSFASSREAAAYVDNYRIVEQVVIELRYSIRYSNSPNKHRWDSILKDYGRVASLIMESEFILNHARHLALPNLNMSSLKGWFNHRQKSSE